MAFARNVDSKAKTSRGYLRRDLTYDTSIRTITHPVRLPRQPETQNRRGLGNPHQTRRGR